MPYLGKKERINYKLSMTTLKTNPCFEFPYCFGYEGEVEERDLVIFRYKPIDAHINEKVSLRAFN